MLRRIIFYVVYFVIYENQKNLINASQEIEKCNHDRRNLRRAIFACMCFFFSFIFGCILINSFFSRALQSTVRVSKMLNSSVKQIICTLCLNRYPHFKFVNILNVEHKYLTEKKHWNLVFRLNYFLFLCVCTKG